MAREEADREDLLGDATAFVERIEWRLPSGDPTAQSDPPGQIVFAGFRADDAVSFYFDADPVYHFNAAGQLRRAFCQGLLLKAERGQLVELSRRRSATEVSLTRNALDAPRAAKFLEQMQLRLGELRRALAEQTVERRGQVPATGNIEQRVIDWLRTEREFSIAQRPHARG